jgi:hypothetical protein
METGNYCNCDTEKLLQTSKDIDTLLTEYENDINDFFELLNFRKQDQSAWTGNNAKKYTDVVTLDKQEYLSFGEGIKDISKGYRDFANDLETTIKENEDDCESGQDEFIFSYRTGGW